MASRRCVSWVATGLLLLVSCNKKESTAGSDPPSTAPPTAPAGGASQTADKDCAAIDGAAAASILGVPKVRPNPYEGHQKLSPDNMDVLACGYVDASPDPMGPTLRYTTFSPTPADMPSVWESHQTGRHERTQSFAPNVGEASAGWVSENAQPTYAAAIAFRTATKIFEINASGFSTAEAAKAAAVKAATTLQKSAGS